MRRVVLVTGATGLIGRHTLRPLKELGFDIVGVARRPPVSHAFRHVAVDLLDSLAVEAVLGVLRPTHLLHCAWDVTHGRFWDAPENASWVVATLALADAAGRHGVHRFVAVGSAAEYDWTDATDEPRRETDRTCPQTGYGHAKNATRVLLELRCRHLAMSFAWGRVFDVFGPGEAPQRLVASLMGALRAGISFKCRHGQLVRDYMAAADVGAALAALVASDVAGCVNIASGRSISLADLTAMIAARLGRPDLLTIESRPIATAPLRMSADVTRLRQWVHVRAPPDLSIRLAEICVNAGAR